MRKSVISGQYNVKEKMQRIAYPVGTGILLYSVITLVPVSIFYNKYLSVGSANALASQKPYAEVIFSGFSGLLKFNMGAILENFFHNIYFYLFHYLFIGVGPVLFITAAIFMLKDKRSKIFIWLTICLLMPVLLYIVSTPHYVLGVSVFMIYFGSLGLYVHLFFIFTHSILLSIHATKPFIFIKIKAGFKSGITS